MKRRWLFERAPHIEGATEETAMFNRNVSDAIWESAIIVCSMLVSVLIYLGM
jgi:hypothetical protein